MTLTYIFQHLLSPDQYSPPKKMLEFSRKQQEDTIVKEIEDDVKQLTQDEADLEVRITFYNSQFHSEFFRNMPRGSERFPNQNN